MAKTAKVKTIFNNVKMLFNDCVNSCYSTAYEENRSLKTSPILNIEHTAIILGLLQRENHPLFRYN